MARKATRDTYGFIVVTPGDEPVEVRQQIKAGAIVPDGMRLEDEKAAETVEVAGAIVGYQPHQIRDPKKEDGQEPPTDDSEAAAGKAHSRRTRSAS